MDTFDYYSAGVDTSPDHVLGVLLQSFNFASLDDARPTNGYERAKALTEGDRSVCTVQWGGNTGEAVQVKASGDSSPDVACVVRREFGDSHRVQRADVRGDYCEDDVWRVLTEWGIHIAKKHRCRTSTSGDWVQGVQGRTLYIGSRQSVAYLRIYEKGKQIGGDPDHVRVELECKPKGAIAGYVAAKLQPLEFWGASLWSQDFSELLLEQRMERIKLGTVWKPSDDERAFQHMLKQYGPVMARLAKLKGTATVLSDIGSAINSVGV